MVFPFSIAKFRASNRLVFIAWDIRTIFIFAETLQGSVPRWDDDQERRDGIGPAEGRNKCSRGEAFQGCWRDETCDDRGNNCNIVWTEQSIVFIDKVTMAWSSMNHGDVFVLDSGKKIFVWKGSGASGQEKMTAGQIAARWTNLKIILTLEVTIAH